MANCKDCDHSFLAHGDNRCVFWAQSSVGGPMYPQACPCPGYSRPEEKEEPELSEGEWIATTSDGEIIARAHRPGQALALALNLGHDTGVIIKKEEVEDEAVRGLRKKIDIAERSLELCKKRSRANDEKIADLERLVREKREQVEFYKRLVDLHECNPQDPVKAPEIPAEPPHTGCGGIYKHEHILRWNRLIREKGEPVSDEYICSCGHRQYEPLTG